MGPERICAGQNAAEGWAVLQDPFKLSGIGCPGEWWRRSARLNDRLSTVIAGYLALF
jgi:hypothetical protein